jgi:thioredoxin reductase/Fe-S-cluster-containing hydrogenase component 2
VNRNETEPLSESCELLVVGGGPAGLGAAIEAGRRGTDVLLVDENPVPGGQLFKQIHKFFGSGEHHSGVRGFRIGETLLEEALSCGTRILSGSRVVGVLRDGRVAVSSGSSTTAITALRIVIAAGGKENSLPFPGWTLPGVMTAGAAQTMCNVHRVLPARRALMVGSGNVGLIVGYQLIQAGASLAGIVEIASKAGGYFVHAAKLRRAGVPFYTGHRVLEAFGDKRVEAVSIVSTETGEERIIEADGLFLSTGLTPRSELPIMFGCKLVREPVLGGDVPLHDGRMESSVRGIYVAGDAAGIEEANTSLDEGRLAGIAVAQDLGKLEESEALELMEEVRARLDGLRSGEHGEKRREAKRRVLHSAGAFAAGLPAELSPAPEQEPVPASEAETPAVKKKRGRSYPVIECPEHIPCNPCVSVCPVGAISMGSICALPLIDYELCTGCMKCVSACPGQAIFMVDPKGSVTLPWEYLPAPQKGERVVLLDRDGKDAGNGTVSACRGGPGGRSGDRTMLVSLEMEAGLTETVRGFRRIDNE